MLQINYGTIASNDTTTGAAAANCTISVYDIILQPGQLYSLIVTQNVSTAAAAPSNRSLLELNVRPAVQRWLRQPHDMYGLVVRTDCANAGPLGAERLHQRIRLRRGATESDADWAQHQPTLSVPTKSEIKRRRRSAEPTVQLLSAVRNRRHAAGAGAAPAAPAALPAIDAQVDGRQRNRRQAAAVEPAIAPAAPAASAPAAGAPALPTTNTTVAGRQTCRMQPMYVDFASIGWSNWIVAPHGFESNFCHGQCRQPRGLHPSNHALIQAEVNRQEPHRVPAPCCVPTRYDPISVIYVGSKHQFLTTEFPRMVATQCGCR